MDSVSCSVLNRIPDLSDILSIFVHHAECLNTHIYFIHYPPAVQHLNNQLYRFNPIAQGWVIYIPGHP